MSNIDEINATNAVMQGGKPIVTFKKVILGEVFINVWDSFTESPVGLILSGEEGSESSRYDVWNENELRYFKLRNKKMLETGYIIPYVPVEVEDKEVEKRKETYSDEELKEVLSSKYFKLRSFLNDVDSEPVVYRLLNLAESMDKPHKTVDSIKAKLAEVQSVVR